MRERKGGQALDLDVEEEGHGGPGVLLDEVEPDGGLVGDVLDHPVHAVLHCTAATEDPKKQAKSGILRGGARPRTGGGRWVATVTAEEAVGGGERQRRRGGDGGGGRGAVVHVRARRRPTITDSPPPLGEGF